MYGIIYRLIAAVVKKYITIRTRKHVFRKINIVKWGKKKKLVPYGGKKKCPLQLYDVVNHKNEYMC